MPLIKALAGKSGLDQGSFFAASSYPFVIMLRCFCGIDSCFGCYYCCWLSFIIFPSILNTFQNGRYQEEHQRQSSPP